MAHERLDPDTEELWQEFHGLVNMTGDELRTWLMTDASGPEAFESGREGPGEGGRHLVRILDKRRVDLVDDDVVMMRRTVEAVRDLLARPRPEDDVWRRALMDRGHDPLKPDSPRPDEDADIGGAPE